MDWMDVLASALRSSLGPAAAVYALAAIGLNVHYGYTGLLNFGQVGFMLVGAYGVGIGVQLLGLPYLVGIVMSLGFALILAVLLGVPTLRLRADYFAITTIATAEILRIVIRSGPFEPLTGGVYGLQAFAQEFYAWNVIPAGRYELWLLSYTHQNLWMMLVTWTLVALVSLAVLLLMRSPWGRVIKSIREDEDAARSLGKNAFGYKMQSLMIGGAIGGLAGAMFATSGQSAHPDSYLPQLTFFAYTVLIMGGAVTIIGPIIGSVIFWFIIASSDTILRQASSADLLPAMLARPESVGAVRLIIVGLALMLLMIFRPQGMFGNKREMQLDA